MCVATKLDKGNKVFRKGVDGFKNEMLNDYAYLGPNLSFLTPKSPEGDFGLCTMNGFRYVAA